MERLIYSLIATVRDIIEKYARICYIMHVL